MNTMTFQGIITKSSKFETLNAYRDRGANSYRLRRTLLCVLKQLWCICDITHKCYEVLILWMTSCADNWTLPFIGMWRKKFFKENWSSCKVWEWEKRHLSRNVFILRERLKDFWDTFPFNNIFQSDFITHTHSFYNIMNVKRVNVSNNLVFILANFNQTLCFSIVLLFDRNVFHDMKQARNYLTTQH